MNENQRDEIDNLDQRQDPDEPRIISLDAYRQAHSRPDDQPPEPNDGLDPKNTDAYWAGRNLAMRRSARWAA